MMDDPQKHPRSVRLKGYDYSQPGVYFITMVTYGRECIFGEIVDGEVRLSHLGQIAEECWRVIPDHFLNVELGVFVVMPNHVHGIVIINDDPNRDKSIVGATHASPLQQKQRPYGAPRESIGAIIGSFKSAVSRRAGWEYDSTHIWQRNYYEHIIRNEKEHSRINLYIESNPKNWVDDEYSEK